MRMQLELKTRGFDDGPSKDAGRRTREHCGGFQLVTKLPDTSTMDN